MDDARIGRSLRVLRTRRRLRQLDVARRAGVSQGSISLIERGHIASVSMRVIRAAFGAVDAGFEGIVSWRDGELDRALDEAHARLVAATAQLLQAHRWDVAPEVTFSRYGERGSIDLLATRRGLSVALVVEAKTALLSIEETLRRLDAKARLASPIVFDREGWRPTIVGTLLVVLDTSTQRRRVAIHDAVLRRAFPDRNAATRRWLRDPGRPIRALMFLSPTNPGSTRAARSSGSGEYGVR